MAGNLALQIMACRFSLAPPLHPPDPPRLSPEFPPRLSSRRLFSVPPIAEKDDSYVAADANFGASSRDRAGVFIESGGIAWASVPGYQRAQSR